MISVLIADDHTMIVEGVQRYLTAKLPNFKLFTAENKENLFESLEKYDIDIILLDIRLGSSDARLFIKDIFMKTPQIKIIVVSSYEKPENINQILQMGCHGFVGKSESSEHILEAIKTVSEGKNYLSEQSKESFKQGKDELHKNGNQIKLTKREQEVLKETLNEKSIKDIAETLFISEKTVENHRSNLFIKFDVKNVAGLVKKAILLGFHSV